MFYIQLWKMEKMSICPSSISISTTNVFSTDKPLNRRSAVTKYILVHQETNGYNDTVIIRCPEYALPLVQRDREQDQPQTAPKQNQILYVQVLPQMGGGNEVMSSFTS